MAAGEKASSVLACGEDWDQLRCFEVKTGEKASSVLAAMAPLLPEGMSPVGEPFAGPLVGSHREFIGEFSFLPGKCYSVAAVGVGVTGLHVVIRGLAKGKVDDGPTTVLGSRADGCWRYPLNVGATAVIFVGAVHGSGSGVAQVYVK